MSLSLILTTDAVLKSDTDFVFKKKKSEAFCVPGNWNEDIVQKLLTFHILVNMPCPLYVFQTSLRRRGSRETFKDKKSLTQVCTKKYKDQFTRLIHC